MSAIALAQSFFIRYFFVGMALLFLAVTVTGFYPNMHARLTGAVPMHWIVHVHGAIMTVWLLLFLAQTWLAAVGHLEFHRRLGLASVGLVGLIVMSGLVTWYRFLLASNFPVEHFHYRTLFLGLMNQLMFCLLFTWGLRLRRQDLAAHRRLMLLCMVPLLQPATDRMAWLPGIYDTAYTCFLYLDVVLLPVFFYDWATLKRIHPKTWSAVGVILLGQGIGLVFSDSPAWHQFWFDFFNSRQ